MNLPVLDHFQLLSRLNAVIRRSEPLDRTALAARFDISPRTLYRYVEELRAFGAPIAYCAETRKFHHERPFTLRFDLESVDKALGALPILPFRVLKSLLQIDRYLREKGAATLDALKAHLRVSRACLYRRLEDLKSCGAPLYFCETQRVYGYKEAFRVSL